MRGRSSTISSTRTRSVSFSARLAFNLALNRGHTLESLPTEILLEIIRMAATLHSPRGSEYRLLDDNVTDVVKNSAPRLDHPTLRSLALTSRILAGLAHTTLYACISLTSTNLTMLYARTVVDCAHRDITLVSTTSPVSPTAPTCSTFSDIPTLFAGKFTNCLSLEYPFHDYSPRAMKSRNTIAEVERFYAASGALLGVGPSAPSVQSPVLASLRTLVIDSCILEYHLKHTVPFVGFPIISPTPSELILHSYIPWTHASSPSSYSPLSPLATRLTHLTITSPPKKWTLPSVTLAALEDAPFLTHFALVRRANANEDNDDEFVRDVEEILSKRGAELKSVVLVVLPDSGFTTWKDSHVRLSDLSAEDEVEDDASLNADLRFLTSYLSRTYIWSKLSTLSHRFPRIIRLIPGSSSSSRNVDDAWMRALQKSLSDSPIFVSNVFHDFDGELEGCGRDLWRWAKKFEAWRRTREGRGEGMCVMRT